MTLRKNRRTPTINDVNQIDFLNTLGETPTLIEIPELPENSKGADYIQLVKAAANRAINECPFNREQIAQALTLETGVDITKPMLDTYTGKARPNNFPAYLIPAFTRVLGPSFIQALAEPAGCVVLERHEAVAARYGQLQLITIQVKQQQQELLNELPMFAGRG